MAQAARGQRERLADMGAGLSRGRVVLASVVGRGGVWLVGPGFPGRRERAQLFGGVARLIFEGWVPHDPVFVAVRCLGSGAATVVWLVAAHSRFADCSSRRV